MLMTEVKKLGLFSRLRKKPELPEVPKTTIGMPRMRQVVKDGIVVNEVEFVLDYGPDSSLLVNDFALQNLMAAGIDIRSNPVLPNVETGSLSLADSAIDGLSNS